MIDDRPLSKWWIEHAEKKVLESIISHRKQEAVKHAKAVVRSGGFLLHIDRKTGAERKITVKEAANIRFLSVWPRDGWEYTKIRVWPGVCARPPGQGWEFCETIPEEHSTEWRRRPNVAEK